MDAVCDNILFCKKKEVLNKINPYKNDVNADGGLRYSGDNETDINFTNLYKAIKPIIIGCIRDLEKNEAQYTVVMVKSSEIENPIVIEYYLIDKRDLRNFLKYGVTAIEKGTRSYTCITAYDPILYKFSDKDGDVRIQLE